MLNENDEEISDDEEVDGMVNVYRRRNRRLFVITLNNAQQRLMPNTKDLRPVYYGGEEINGNLTIEIDGGKPVKQVKLMLTCLIQFHILTQSPRQSFEHQQQPAPTKRRKSIFADYFTSSNEKQIYFDRKNVLQFDLLTPDKKLTEGKHELPFRFQLPKDLPSTMKGTNGLIKYTIEAYTIDEETLNESRGEKEIILLMPLFDLKPLNRKVEKTFKFGTGANMDGDGLDDDMGIQAVLDKKSYNPGDKLRLELSIQNQSEQNIECRINVYQRQIIINYNNQKQQLYDICIGQYPSKEDNENVDSDAIRLEPNDNLEKKIIEINLPKNLVLTLNSPFIIVKYFLLITINDIPGNNNRHHLKMPFLVAMFNPNKINSFNSTGSGKKNPHEYTQII